MQFLFSPQGQLILALAALIALNGINLILSLRISRRIHRRARNNEKALRQLLS